MAPDPTSTIPLLPVGTRLLHIGPPKSGTTALQYAFHVARRACREQGVHYAGPTHQPAMAARAVVGVTDPILGRPSPKRYWRLLRWEVNRARAARVVISSEVFAQAPPAAISEIVDDLDPARLHIVVTLRPIDRLLCSQYQQAVQTGLAQPFDQWLRAVFDGPRTGRAGAFWLRHRHDELVARWADAVGPDRVTVVALDERDRTMVLRVFECLTGLRPNTLALLDGAENRSLTSSELRVIQGINDRFRAEGLDRPLHRQLVTLGAAAYLKRVAPGPDESRIELPAWAADRARDIAGPMVEGLTASGVNVLGDPACLVPGPGGGDAGPRTGSTDISPETAAEAAMGALLMCGLARGASPSVASGIGTGLTNVDLVPTLQLWAVLWQRCRSASAARIHAIPRPFDRGRRSSGQRASRRFGHRDEPTT